MDELEVRKQMNEAIVLVQSDISTIRTGRASSSLVESIVVAAYGGTQRLKIMELASIILSDPQTILIEPWDKSIIGEIRQAILAANIGLTPILSETNIRVTLPALTGEDREKFVKILSAKLENGRIAIRQIRGTTMHKIKKAFEDKEITEDERFSQEKSLQKITDEMIAKIEEIGKQKEQELLSL